MKTLKYEQGALTIEAAVTLPIFICIVISIAFLMKIVYVHELIQHAVSETANEISTYSYIYSVSGMQKLNDETIEGLDAQKELIKRQINTIADTVDSFEGLRQKDITEKYKNAKSVIDEIIQNPKEEIKSLIYAFASEGTEELKTQLVLEPLAKSLIIKYFNAENFTEADKRLISLNVVNGFKGLDFSQSSLFRDKKHIDLVVRYKIKLNLPVNILPQLSFIQRAKVRAWLDGEKGIKENIWELGAFERGKKIQVMYGRNLPENFKTITKFENGTAVRVISINLNDKTYRENKRNVVYKVNKAVNDLVNFESDTKTSDEDGRKIQYYINVSDIKYKQLIVVIPENTDKKSFEKIFRECSQNAKQNGIDLIIEKL